MPCCDEYVDLISAAIDGALSEEETARLEEHLARCPECRALYEDFAVIHSALGDVPPVAVPPAFACMDQVMAAIDHQADLRKANVKYRRYWQRGMAAAAVLAIVLVGRAGFSGRQLPAQHSETQVVTARSAADTPALSEAGPEHKLPQLDEAQIAPQNRVAPPAETGEVKQEETPVVRSTAGDAPELSQPQDRMATAVSTPTPAPVQGPMLRSMPIPAGDSGINETENTVAETVDADVMQTPAVQPFAASLPLPSETPEATEAPEEEPSPVPNAFLTSSAPTEEELEREEASRTDTAEEIPLSLTPQDALELAAERVLAHREAVENLERVDSEGEDGSPACTLRWTEGESQYNILLQYCEQEDEPDVYYIDCTWEDSEDGAGAFLYLVEKTTGEVGAMDTD